MLNRVYYQRILLIILVSAMVPTSWIHAQLGEAECKFLGNIIAGSVPSDYSSYWNQVTPENSGKWGSVESTRDNPNWTQLDLAYDFAMTNGYPFKQHTFVWGQQQPSWITALSSTEQKQEVEEFMQSYCERYPDTDMIDVVNEPLHAPPSFAAALGGNGVTGWDWVITSFTMAREYCPNAKLILNDYNIVSNNTATNQFLTIINLLKERDLIDGIGEQGHFLETTPTSTITGNLDKLAATGLPVYISEFDLNFADDVAQRNKYQELFPLLWEHPGVKGITLWGYRQNEIWRTDAYLVRSNGTKRLALTWLETYMESLAGSTDCDPVTAIDEDELNETVFPNPVIDGKLYLRLSDEKAKVSLMDQHGKLINAFSIAQRETSLALNVPQGFYLIKVETNSGIAVHKLIVK
jgi:endo-1,4-beta-xylanase